MAEDDIKFIDGETFRNAKSDLISFKQIVLNQVSRVTQLMSKEFHGGYYNEKVKMIDGIPTTTRTYIEDSREQFKNALFCLQDLLIAKFDKNMENDLTAFNESLSKFLISLDKARETKEIDDDEIAKNRLVQHYRLLFQALIRLLDRKDYLQDESYEE